MIVRVDVVGAHTPVHGGERHVVVEVRDCYGDLSVCGRRDDSATDTDDRASTLRPAICRDGDRADDAYIRGKCNVPKAIISDLLDHV